MYCACLCRLRTAAYGGLLACNPAELSDVDVQKLGAGTDISVPSARCAMRLQWVAA